MSDMVSDNSPIGEMGRDVSRIQHLDPTDRGVLPNGGRTLRLSLVWPAHYSGLIEDEMSDKKIVPELLTTKQAALLCNVGERTLWRWSHSGQAPKPLKIGPNKRSATRYRRQELLSWIVGGCQPLIQNG